MLSADAMVDATPHSHHANAAHLLDYSHSHNQNHIPHHSQHVPASHHNITHQPLKSHLHNQFATATHMPHVVEHQQQYGTQHASQNGHGESSSVGVEAIEEEVTSPASTSSSSSASSSLSSSSSSTASSTSPPHSTDITSPPLVSTSSPSPPPLSEHRTSATSDDLLTAEDVEEVLEAAAGDTAEPTEAELESDEEAQVKRVKVYQLNDVGQWDDKGTGQVSILHPHSPQMCIEVKAERDSADQPPQPPQPVLTAAASTTALSSLTLLHHRIVDGQDYQRQGDTIITWCENSTGLDLALSFQDTDGCTAIWSLITALQQTGEAELVVPDRHSIGADEEVTLTLPAVAVDTLDELVTKTTVTIAAQKDYMAAALMRAGSGVDSGAYMVQLFALHRQCEETYERSGEDDDERRRQLRHLELLFAVMRNLFLLNDANVIEWLVTDERFMQTTALLEYDPAYSATPSTSSHSSSSSPSSPSASASTYTSTCSPSPTLLPPLSLHDYHHHRSFLSSSCFLTFPSLSADPTLPSKIRQSYHLTYVKDVLLLRHLDDAALSTLSSMLFLNSVGLVSRMNERREWMSEVMDLMRRAMSSQPGSTSPSSSSATASATTVVAASSPSSADSSAASSPLSTPSTLSSLSSVSPTYISPLLLASSSHVVSPSTHSLELIRRHIFAFLQELLILAKTVQVPLRDAFYRGLCEAGLLDVVEEAMKRVWMEEEDERKRWVAVNATRGDRRLRRRRAGEWEAEKEKEKDDKRSMWVWITCTDMLTSLLMHDANIVRQHILPAAPSAATAMPAASDSADTLTAAFSPTTSTPSSSSLLSTIFSPLQSSHLYLGMGHQLSCILRLLLDPDTQSLDEEPSSSAFLDHIYSTHMPSLLTCLTSQPVSPACYHVTELLSFCVLHHGWLFPTWCARVGLFERLWQLMEGLSHQSSKCGSKGRMELVCSVIRLLRTCMATRELHYQQQLIADFSASRPHRATARSLLAHLFVLFYSNERYNLLNSSLIDLFLVIKADRLTLVMDEMMDTEGERLERVSYVNVFAGIRYEWSETKMAMAKEKADEEEKTRKEAERHSRQHDKRRHTAGDGDDDDDEDEDGLNGGDGLDDEAEDGSKSSGLGDTEEVTVDEEEDGETEAMESWEKGMTDATAAPSTTRRDELRVRKRKSSGMDDPSFGSHSSSSPHSPTPSSSIGTTVTVSSPPASSNSSPLSIIITKSPTFSATPGSPPLTFSLSRVNNNNHLPYNSSPGSPPLAPSPSSPRSPTSHIHRARSPPPPTMTSPVRFTKSMGGGTTAAIDGMDVEATAAMVGSDEAADVKRRKTASF